MDTLKDIVSVATPILALLIAWLGLSTWKRQLKGTRNLELSRRILVALYKAEMIISDIRHPFVQYHLPEGTSITDTETLNKAYVKTYEEKWSKLSEALSELQAAGIEAKATWDKNFLDSMTPLFTCVNELHDHLSENIQMKLNPRYEPLYDSREIRNVLYARIGSPEKDEFGIKLKNAITQIDETVRRRLISPKNVFKFWGR